MTKHTLENWKFRDAEFSGTLTVAGKLVGGANDHKMYITGVAAAGSGSAGSNVNSRWKLTASGNIWIWIDSFLPQLFLNGTVRFKSIKGYFGISVDEAYIDFSIIRRIDLKTMAWYDDNNTDDTGNGTLGVKTRIHSYTYERAEWYGLAWIVSCTIPSGFIELYGVEITYDLV